MRGTLVLAAALAAGSPATAQQADSHVGTIGANRIELRALDTLSGSTRDIPLTAGETARYGHLEITAEACRVPEADPETDAFALLRIRDIREDAPRFTGWMFASSPALSALDHPRYDVWVLSCSNR